MGSAALLREDTPLELPVVPSAERWAMMTERERDAFYVAAGAALQQQFELMGESSAHSRSKQHIRSVLGDYYARLGRKIYLATELSVYYPGQPVFCPDFLAVRDVEDPGDDDTRRAWNVITEGRGPDLVLEILHLGDRKKDLADNVETYARLGIPEYFVYDRLRNRILGHRLPFPGAGRYVAIPFVGGLLSSRVLDLDLGLPDNKLRFFATGAPIAETRDLLARANGMLDDLQSHVEALERRAEEAERQKEEAERRAEAAEARVAELLARLGER